MGCFGEWVRGSGLGLSEWMSRSFGPRTETLFKNIADGVGSGCRATLISFICCGREKWVCLE